MRPSDEEARRFVGGRASSVFPTLPAEVLAAPTYPEASAIARAMLGRGLSAQSYALRKRIHEVAELAAADPRVIEVHPEVSFAALRGAALRYSKHSWSGVTERRALLAAAGILLPDNPAGGDRSAPDDVVDAAISAWTAHRVATGQSRTLPAVVPTDVALGGVIHY
jgi:predicted RNase H-like nuclease